ncbi:diheme cytochrome c [Polynucleobacter sp. 31A-FELB]|uniref:diheme cytochrome c n=1 Tax=Polynucleobacter sp. 31A-FELB TaxID=2689096 RepID=UPI0021033B2B|nr:diheme cytochrome c [Polynucleobacter sp. 31A-FELB]
MAAMRFKKLGIALAFLFVDIPLVFAHTISMPKDMPSSYEAECASCHMAYPPGLLSRKSWQNVMSSLDAHFGADASIALKTREELTTWLVRNAATGKQFSEAAPQNRITTTAWFMREHRKVNAEVWRRSGVKSPSNCGACHMDAGGGVFHDTNVKVPTQ